MVKRASVALTAFLVYRDNEAHARSYPLDPDVGRLRIGRGADADLRLQWDSEVSRIHAELERIGGAWAIIDDGISANGTFVNGERLTGRRRLGGDEVILIGTTSLTYRAMADGDDTHTHVPTLGGPAIELSPMQKRVLVELCRPYKDRGIHSVIPATNQSIADELCVSVDAVKMHLRALFGKFAIADLPQNEKRVRLVELAFERRAISDGDLA